VNFIRQNKGDKSVKISAKDFEDQSS